MFALAKVAALGLLAAPFAPHAFDRPLADITVESRATGVRIGMMMNFQFIDSALGLTGDANVVPSAKEIADVRARLVVLFESRELVRGSAPVLSEFEIAPPPEALRIREPHLARKLTQVRFTVDYATGTAPRAIQLRWSWFPEHALYDIPNSPVAPMEVNVVVMRGEDTPDVLTFTVDAPEREIVFATPPDDPTTGAVRTGSASPSHAIGLSALRVAGFVIVLIVFIMAMVSWRRRAVGAAMMVAASLALVGCSTEVPDAVVAEVNTQKTKSYEVVLTMTPAMVPVNEHFVVEARIRALDGGDVPDSVQIDADMPSHGHGMNTKPRLTRLGDGKWRAEGMLFHMPGEWELYVYVGLDKAMERAAFPLKL
jgi:hypothetical protein